MKKKKTIFTQMYDYYVSIASSNSSEQNSIMKENEYGLSIFNQKEFINELYKSNGLLKCSYAGTIYVIGDLPSDTKRRFKNQEKL